jgi:spermidine/putrescine-binding protein
MPSADAIREVSLLLADDLQLVVVASNERLEEKLGSDPPFDVIFPSDYLVERLRDADRLVELGPLPVERLEPWAIESEHDPGCRHSVPFAFGTTGILCGPLAPAMRSWHTLLAPPPGMMVGMLDEAREVVGAALIASGRSPNDWDDDALRDARALLLSQRPAVLAYNSDDFCEPVTAGRVTAHHAWSGPAARTMSTRPNLSYAVPDEGAVLWTTAAAIPSDAPDPEHSIKIINELMDPRLAALTTATHGYATPNHRAREILPPAIRDDPVLFPDRRTRERCTTLSNLGPHEAGILNVWAEVTSHQEGHT